LITVLLFGTGFNRPPPLVRSSYSASQRHFPQEPHPGCSTVCCIAYPTLRIPEPCNSAFCHTWLSQAFYGTWKFTRNCLWIFNNGM